MKETKGRSSSHLPIYIFVHSNKAVACKHVNLTEYYGMQYPFLGGKVITRKFTDMLVPSNPLSSGF